MTEIEFSIKKKAKEVTELSTNKGFWKIAGIASGVIVSYLLALVSFSDSTLFGKNTSFVAWSSALVCAILFGVMLWLSYKFNSRIDAMKQRVEHLEKVHSILVDFAYDSFFDVESFIQHVKDDRQQALTQFDQIAFPLISAINLLVVLPMLTFASAGFTNLVTFELTLAELKLFVQFFGLLLILVLLTVVLEFKIVFELRSAHGRKDKYLQTLLEDLIFIKRHPPMTIRKFVDLLSGTGSSHSESDMFEIRLSDHKDGADMKTFWGTIKKIQK